MLSSVSTSIVTVEAVLSPIAITTVALRLSVRGAKSETLRADDYLILGALTMMLCSSGACIAGVITGGLGYHIRDVDLETVIVFLKISYGLQFTYLFAVTSIKLSVLLFYKRLFVSHRFGVAVKIMCALVVIWFVGFVLAILFHVTPISINWTILPDTTYSHRLAFKEYKMYTAMAACDLVLDIMTLTLPLFVIWRLQMRSAQKWQVTGIILLGSFVCLASIMRLYYIALNLAPATLRNKERQSDVTFNAGNIVLWSVIEPLMGIICACLPTLGPVFQQRSLKSTVRNMSKFFFSHRSRQDNDVEYSRRITHGSATRRMYGDSSKAGPFYPMDDRAIVTTVTPLPKGERELVEYPSGQIVVDCTVERNSEDRK